MMQSAIYSTENKPKEKRRNWLWILLIAFCIQVGTTFIRYENLAIDVPVSFVLFLLAALLVIYKGYFTPGQSFKWFTTSLILIQMFGMLIDWSFPSVGIPNIISGFLGAWAGCIIDSKKTAIAVKLLIPIAVCAFSIWYISGGIYYWFNYLGHGNFTGRVKPAPIKGGWVTYTKSGDTLTPDFYKGKVVLLDFWSTNCGICFRAFPELEQMYQKYKDKPNFSLQAVNIPIDRDTTGQAFYMIERRHKYTFPVVIGNETMRQAFNIEAYPTSIIIKNGNLVFKGRSEIMEKALKEALIE